MCTQTENQVCYGHLRKQEDKPLSLMQLQRVRLGLTQKRLGDLTGISHVTVALVESGKRPQIGLRNANKIASILGLRPDELLLDLRNAEIEIRPVLEEIAK